VLILKGHPDICTASFSSPIAKMTLKYKKKRVKEFKRQRSILSFTEISSGKISCYSES
jgi:hypothetical protein